jgi:hypothetical protein
LKTLSGLPELTLLLRKDESTLILFLNSILLDDREWLLRISRINTLVSLSNIMELTDSSTNSRCKLLRSRHLDACWNRIKSRRQTLRRQNSYNWKAVILAAEKGLPKCFWNPTVEWSGSKRYYRLQDQAPAAQTKGYASLIWAFSEKRKDCDYALMAEHSVFCILFIPPTKTANPVLGGSCLPWVQWVLQTGDAFSKHHHPSKLHSR